MFSHFYTEVKQQVFYVSLSCLYEDYKKHLFRSQYALIKVGTLLFILWSAHSSTICYRLQATPACRRGAHGNGSSS